MLVTIFSFAKQIKNFILKYFKFG